MTTTRRQFLRGAVSAAVAASLPGGDGVALYSAKHPYFPTANSDINPLKYIEQGPRPVFLPFVTDNDTGMFRTGADTLKLVVGGIERLALPFDQSSLEEIEIEIPERS